ncbi:MAG: peroxiredoxin family protein [Rhodospirillaceae bacterium]|nr:peroxiredoxin family protein [Rhodospirillaceae bacterium]
MRPVRSVIAFVFAALFALAAAAAPIDIGPAVGAKIPAPFTALDKTGAAKTYADITGKNGTVLLFVRSASWCPFCQVQLIDINRVTADLAKRGYTLAALSYDAPEVLATFAKQRGIAYTLLSDQKSAMIDAFDLRDPQYPVGNVAHGVPKPAIFVIDANGVVQAKLAEEGYRVRPLVDDMLAAVDGVKRK